MSFVISIAFVLLALGLTLLFFGNRLAQWSFNWITISAAGLGAFAIGRALSLETWQVWLLTALATGVACLLAALLFRLSMGFTTLLFLAIFAALVVLVWQAAPLPHLAISDKASQNPAFLPHDWQDNMAALGHWWGKKNSEERRPVKLAMAIGAMLGLGLGLAAPLRAAAVQCAGLGAALVLMSAHALVSWYWPAGTAYFPDQPRVILLLFAGLMVVGLLAQGTGRDEEKRTETKKVE